MAENSIFQLFLKKSYFHEFLPERLRIVVGQIQFIQNMIDGTMVAEYVIMFGICNFVTINGFVVLCRLTSPIVACVERSRIDCTIAVTFDHSRWWILYTFAKVYSFQCLYANSIHTVDFNSRCCKTVIVFEILYHFPSVGEAKVSVRMRNRYFWTSNLFFSGKSPTGTHSKYSLIFARV